MKHLKIAGLCLVAVFIINAAMTAVASASPTKPYWDQCSRTDSKGEGEWTNFECNVKAEAGKGEWAKVEVETETKQCVTVQVEKTGRWKAGCTELEKEGAWVKAKPQRQFTSTSGVSELVTAAGTKVICKTDTNQGEITGPHHIYVIIHFKGCKSNVLERKCKSANAAAEEITTKPLKGWLFYIKSTAPVEVGMWLAANSGTLFAEFECGGITNKVFSIEHIAEAEEPATGSCVAGKITNKLNEMLHTGSLAFEGTAANQSIEKFEYEGKKLHCHLEAEVFGVKERATQITKEDTILWEDDMDLIA
jgi:hypothetical protein